MEDPKLNAQLHRTAAAASRATAAAHGIVASVFEMGAAMMKVKDAITAAEAREVATHPDLAELNVQLDNFYGD